MTVDPTMPAPDELPDDSDLDALDATIAPTGYQSPVLNRMSSQRLTVELLAEEIPRVRAGEKAGELLASGELSGERARTARQQARDGEQAKARLFAAALPLIRTIAQREHRRRQQWNSMVPLDDLMQDAIVGFFRGLAKFDSGEVRNSATNYLGQWMLSEMRRGAEAMDHDLQVGHDAGDRFRRIRALRSRLINDLGREPSDEEIAAASRNPAYLTRPGMVGRAPVEGKERQMGKGVTAAQVAEERAVRNRVGAATRFGDVSPSDDAPSAPGTIAADRVVASPADQLTAFSDPADLIDEAATHEVMAGLISRTLQRMNLPEQQTEIIRRRFGLSPYPDETSAREIARVMGVHRERVSRVLNTFTQEMTRPGGMFHQVVSRIPLDDLVDLGLEWMYDTLGPWKPEFDDQVVIPAALTEPISVAVPGATVSTAAPGNLVTFWCEYHDREFASFYAADADVPSVWPCPECQRPSELVRVARS